MSDPRHSFRYPEDRWRAAKAKAIAQGRTATEIICECLDEFIDGEVIVPIPATVDTRTGDVSFHQVVTAKAAVICHGRHSGALCDCGGFTAQRPGSLRCTCGHAKGVHE